MEEILLVSDNVFLNDVYNLNFSVYLDKKIDIVDSIESAMDRIDSAGPFAAVITIDLIGEEDAGKALTALLDEKNIPLVIVGEKSELSNSPEVLTVPANLNIQFLLRNMAKLLGVTAKDMAEKNVGDYYPMAFQVFLGMSEAPCDVFYKISKLGAPEEFTKVWEEGQPISEKFLQFKDLKILQVYIPSDKRLEITNQVTKTISTRLESGDLGQDQKLEVVEQGFEMVAQGMFSNEEVTEEVMAISDQCIGAVNEIIEADPSLGDLLKDMLANKSRFIYMHSILTTYVGNHILNKISWGSKEHMEKVSYVLFFHDMFLVPIYNDHADIKYEEDLIFSPDLSDEEKDVIINHAKEAGMAMKKMPQLPIGADTIITQHHGTPNGIGFTMDPGDDISPLAKVILISEAFVDEFLKAKDDGNTPIVETMVGELEDKFTKRSYLRIIENLKSIKI